MAKVAIFIEQLYQDSEVTSPRDALKEAGYEVDIIGPNTSDEYIGKKGTKLKANKSIEDVMSQDYIGLVLPGGWAPDKMRMNEKMVRFTQEINSKKKPIASICHGGWMLVEADIIDGKTVTSYKAIRTDMKNAGAKWIDEEVVIDGNIVCSRTPDDLPAFNEAFIKLLSKVPA